MREENLSCENQLLRDIANTRLKRRDLAQTYRYAMQSDAQVDWEKVHQAIIDRWSYFGLEWIRREANRQASE